MNDYKILELKEEDIFDPNTIYEGTPFTQSQFYADCQLKSLRKSRKFVIQKNDIPVCYFQIFDYELLKNKKYLYIPYGPVINDFSENFIIFLKKELESILKESGAVFLRLDFTPKISDDILKKFFKKAHSSTYHSSAFQPRVEQYLDLDKDVDQIYELMDKKDRYSIRQAKSRGAVCKIVTNNFEEYFEDFYALMIETAERNKFSLHKREYYRNYFSKLDSNPENFLVVVSYEEKILVMDVIVVSGGIANYVFAGSSSSERDKLPTYLAQWKAIEYAQKNNCKIYNFGGVTHENNSHDSWEGLTAFKKKFGGYAKIHSDFYDLVNEKSVYFLYNLRKKLSYFIKKFKK